MIGELIETEPAWEKWMDLLMVQRLFTTFMCGWDCDP